MNDLREPLKGISLWLYRAWLYLPIPAACIDLAFFAKFVGTGPDIWFKRSTVLLAVVGLSFISYRHERRYGLRLPTVGEGIRYVTFCFRTLLVLFVIRSIMAGHIDYKFLVAFLFIPVFVLAALPWSVILADESRRNQPKTAGVGQ